MFGVPVGGRIARAGAAARPDRARGLIAADTAAGIGDADSGAARIGAVRERGLGGMAETTLERRFPAALPARPVALHRLGCFRVVAAGRTLTRAADRPNMADPPPSRRIRDPEVVSPVVATTRAGRRGLATGALPAPVAQELAARRAARQRRIASQARDRAIDKIVSEIAQ